MWPLFVAILALVVASLSVFFSWQNSIRLSRKLESSDVALTLEKSSEELSKNYARSVRSIEVEWEDMFQKFSKLAGRMDRQRQLDNAPAKEEPVAPATTRSDLVRRHRGV